LNNLLEEVLAAQSPHGAFRSEVQAQESVSEENCFITTLVLFELMDILSVVQVRPLDEALQRGLRFVEACADPGMYGVFCFYPPLLDTPRYKGVLPPDIDDTVLAWTAAVRLGRRTREAAADMLRRVIEPRAIGAQCVGEPRWLQKGASLTWFTSPTPENAVDLCVNANVVALYALCGQTTHANYTGMVTMLDQALQQTTIALSDMAELAPYYAHRLELLYAVERAVQLGATDLLGTLTRLRRSAWAVEDIDANWPRKRPICCSPAGFPFWIAPALQAARQLSFVLRGRCTSREEGQTRKGGS